MIGSKCKFSHDRNVERRVEKLNIYEDARDKDAEKKDGRSPLALGERAKSLTPSQIRWRRGTRIS